MYEGKSLYRRSLHPLSITAPRQTCLAGGEGDSLRKACKAGALCAMPQPRPCPSAPQAGAGRAAQSCEGTSALMICLALKTVPSRRWLVEKGGKTVFHWHAGVLGHGRPMSLTDGSSKLVLCIRHSPRVRVC